MLTAVRNSGERSGHEHEHAASRLKRWLAERPEQLVTRACAAYTLHVMVSEGLAQLPMPGAGHTLARWQALTEVAAHDLSLAKLFEGHTDALAIMQELGQSEPPAGSTWGTWAAEAPGARVLLEPDDCNVDPKDSIRLTGRKAWCSGAGSVSHALLTAWDAEGNGPWLVTVAMDQPGVRVQTSDWHSVGMAGSAAVDVWFDGALARRVGEAGSYLRRPGFWQGGAGIAACWYGGSLTIAHALHRAAARSSSVASPFRSAALGRVDLALGQTAALLREAAEWIDRHPHGDAGALAMRVRLSAEGTARTVLDEVGRALGAAPFCLDERFARMAVDLPVFVRQSHADKDFAALGDMAAQHLSGHSSWQL